MQARRVLIIIGGLLLIIGSRLPWISVPVLHGVQGPAFEAIEIGWGDSGYITGGIGLILLLVGIFWKGRTGRRYSIPGAILATLAVSMVVGGYSRILEIDPGGGFLGATDVGIHVTFIGGLLALAGAVCRTSGNQERQDAILFIMVIISGLMLVMLDGARNRVFLCHRPLLRTVSKTRFLDSRKPDCAGPPAGRNQS